MATYGSFPGVRVETQQGGIQSVSVGLEEKVVLFGEAAYDASDNVDGNASAGELVTINAPAEAEAYFGESELADGMLEALSNGANIGFLRAVAVPQVGVTGEEHSSVTGSLDYVEVKEDLSTITVKESGGAELDVEFRYTPGVAEPATAGTVHINPLTGEYAYNLDGGSAPVSFDYKHMDYQSAFQENAVSNYVNENETGIFFALSDSDIVSTQLNTVVSTLRTNYALVSGFTFAEPNSELVLDPDQTTDLNGGAEPRYETGDYDTSGNQSVSDNSFFKPAPARLDGAESKTIGGGLAGLYAGNSLSDAVYNEVVSGYSDLEQQLNKTEADDLRSEDLIPVRSGGSVRVKGNRATNFSQSGTAAADFWTRRITDRVILITKQVGDAILGLINNEETRQDAEDAIDRELGSLAADGIIKGNEGDATNYNVTVFESTTNKNQVDIDVQFTPYGIVKEVDASITVNV